MAAVAARALWLVTLFAPRAQGKVLLGSQTAEAAAWRVDREVDAGTKLAAAKCDSPVSQDDVDLGIHLGSQFLVRSQRPAGNFRYEYNWVSQSETDEDNPVRQAGTLWGLSLIHVDDPKSGLLPTIRKGLQYFEKHSVDRPGGVKLMLYPGQEPQKLGSVALLALAHIEVLRQPAELTSEEKEHLEGNLAGYLRALLAARTGKNNFYKYYHGDTGVPFGPSSPYYDGECLLALVKAAKYLGHDHLWPKIKESAEAGWRKNVRGGLKLLDAKKGMNLMESDDKGMQEAMARLKGYYQWGTMAWYELLGMEDPQFAKYGDRTLRYANWLLERAPQKSPYNTGYAFEGIIPAFITATRKGNPELEQRFACAIREGLENLHSLQVGHTKAYGLAEPLPKSADPALVKEERAQGGAQGSRDSAALRIDTTQHQIHALLMAKRLLQKKVLI